MGTQVQPLAEAQEVNWLFCDAYYALSKPGYSMRERLGQLYTACFVNKDAYFDVNDPLPFLALHYLHVPVLLMRNLLRGNKLGQDRPLHWQDDRGERRLMRVH